LLGWFGGYGLDGTMGFLTGAAGLPSVVALLVILIEFFGALFLIAGFATRLAAIGVIGNFLGVVLTSHLNNGFFMNWYSQANKGEGLEYFVLLFGLVVPTTTCPFWEPFTFIFFSSILNFLRTYSFTKAARCVDISSDA